MRPANVFIAIWPPTASGEARQGDRQIITVAGNGSPGYTGDGGAGPPSASAVLADRAWPSTRPANLFHPPTPPNEVLREVVAATATIIHNDRRHRAPGNFSGEQRGRAHEAAQNLRPQWAWPSTAAGKRYSLPNTFNTTASARWSRTRATSFHGRRQRYAPASAADNAGGHRRGASNFPVGPSPSIPPATLYIADFGQQPDPRGGQGRPAPSSRSRAAGNSGLGENNGPGHVGPPWASKCGGGSTQPPTLYIAIKGNNRLREGSHRGQRAVIVTVAGNGGGGFLPATTALRPKRQASSPPSESAV